MKRSMILPALLLCGSLSTAWSGEALDFENKTTRTNYSLGFQIGGDFKRQKVEMDPEAVVQGIRDALSGTKPQMSQADMSSTLIELKQMVVAEQKSHQKMRENEALEAGKKFMQENAGKEGIVATGSGLQYKVLKEGTGKQPGPTDQVSVNYRGKFLDGNEFDSSFKRGKPATFKLNGVIKGWSEGLQLMKEGGKSQLFIPPELGYGKRGPLAHRTLIFEVELLSVTDSTPAE